MAGVDALDMAEPQQHNINQAQSQPRQQKPINTGTWLPAENARLREAVAKFGTRWVKVASEVGSRNGDQCAKRWNENLNPDLDHSPWTPEEDERLLALVKTYGRNWKFMADNCLELRAPLALKNRYLLLMRRLNRQGPGQELASQGPSAPKVGGAKQARQATAPSRTSSANASPSPNSAIDLTNLFNGGGDPQTHPPDYTALSTTSSNFSLPAGLFGADVIASPDLTAINGGRRGGGRGSITLHPTTAAGWDDQDFVWQQQPMLGNGMEPDSLYSSTINSTPENEMNDTTMTSDNRNSIRHLLLSGGRMGLRSMAPPEYGNGGITPDGGVDYAISCQWGKLKTLMCHLVDAAMSECKDWTADDDQVSVKFQMKVL